MVVKVPTSLCNRLALFGLGPTHSMGMDATSDPKHTYPKSTVNQVRDGIFCCWRSGVNQDKTYASAPCLPRVQSETSLASKLA